MEISFEDMRFITKHSKPTIDSAVAGGGQVSVGHPDIGIERRTDIGPGRVCELDIQVDRSCVDGLDRDDSVRRRAGCHVGIGVCVGASVSHVIVIGDPSAALIDQAQVNTVVRAVDSQANKSMAR